jgi:dihydrofolate reductase
MSDLSATPEAEPAPAPIPRRRVLAQQWISADGFAAGPTDESEIFAAVDDFSASEHHNMALLAGVDVVLLGRRTYESFVTFWPEAEDEPMAQLVNSVRKVVCSTTLTQAPWGRSEPATVVADGVGHVRELTAEAGGDVLVWGSLELMRSLLRAGLVTDLELFVAPVGLGAGTPLLAPEGPYRLQLRDGDIHPSGTVRLRYAVTYP